MMGYNIRLKEKYIKLSLSYPFYPFLPGALVLGLSLQNGDIAITVIQSQLLKGQHCLSKLHRHRSDCP